MTLCTVTQIGGWSVTGTHGCSRCVMVGLLLSWGAPLTSESRSAVAVLLVIRDGGQVIAAAWWWVYF